MKVMLSVLAHSTIQPATAKAVAEASEQLAQHGHVVTTYFVSQESLISRGRDAVAAQFLNGLDEVLVTIDSDIVFRAEDVSTLLKREVDLVCANYPRKPDGRPTLKVALGEFVESEAIALGFAAIRRSAFEVLIRRRDADPDFPLDYYPRQHNPCVWAFFLPFVFDDRYLTETEAFAHRLRRAGVALHVDGAINVGHIAKTTLTPTEVTSP